MRCMDRVSLERLLGQGLSLAAIGRRFDLQEATVSYWVKKHGLQAVNHGKHRARGGLTRDELEQLVEKGATIAQIAEAVDRSKATVRHWLTRHGLKTHGGPGRRPAAQAKAAKQAGLATVAMRCASRRYRVLAHWTGLLPLQAMPICRSRPQAPEGEGNPGRGSRRPLLHLRISTQHACLELPPCRSVAEETRDQRQGRSHCARQVARRGTEVRPSML